MPKSRRFGCHLPHAGGRYRRKGDCIAWTLTDPAVHLGGITITGVPAAVGSVLVGLLLLAALPSLVRLLARADAALVGTVLR